MRTISCLLFPVLDSMTLSTLDADLLRVSRDIMDVRISAGFAVGFLRLVSFGWH